MIGAMAGLGALSTAINMGSNIYNMLQSNADRKRAERLQQQIFEREDTAIQRRVADAQQAGINPITALGEAGAGAGQVVSTPQISGEAGMLNLAGDMAGLMTAGNGADANDIKKMEIEQAANQFAETMGLERDKFNASVQQFYDNLQNEKDLQKLAQEWQSNENALQRQITMAIENMKDQTQKKIAMDNWTIQNRQINEQIREYNKTHDLAERQYKAYLIQSWVLGGLNAVSGLVNAGANLKKSLNPFSK